MPDWWIDDSPPVGPKEDPPLILGKNLFTLQKHIVKPIPPRHEIKIPGQILYDEYGKNLGVVHSVEVIEEIYSPQSNRVEYLLIIESISTINISSTQGLSWDNPSSNPLEDMKDFLRKMGKI